MGLQDLFNWRTQTVASITAVVSDEDLAADVDEHPDHRSLQYQQADFHKSTVRPQGVRRVSLITKALCEKPEKEPSKSQVRVATDLSRRRSMISNASLASTAELTSDGGLTSPARTNTPSPPPPTYTSFALYSLAAKSMNPPVPMSADVEIKEEALVAEHLLSPQALPPAAAPPKKRCISFQCGKTRPQPAPPAEVAPAPVTSPESPKPRACKIKFACAMKPSEERSANSQAEDTSHPKVTEPEQQVTSRSPYISRKSPRLTSRSSPKPHRDSSTMRRASQSPLALRAKPKYINADELTLKSSEATRFHEFASEEVQEDDWIRKDTENPKAKLTINDTLKMENAIRQLGNEAEEEALEEDENEEEDDDEGVNYSEDDDDFGEGDDDEDDFGSLDGSDDGSDGNETDNEAGFADSDDESDAGEFAFWTPGRNIAHQQGDASTYRASAHRAASASSIDSLSHLDSVLGPKGERKPRRRPMKIRPGTPELPDSTDFVCGTLDEDRPIENAYISCMEARKNAKHKQTPQDIDPSFPTSDPDDEEDDEDVVESTHDSDEHVWLHGKFEESDHEQQDRHRSTTSRRKSPMHSPRRLHSPPPPRRLHSPPPPRQRLRSPPPRKLFGHSPKRMRSPPPARAIRSPAASPTMQGSKAINFAPLAQRPGLTHTKSLPRAPNTFGRQYRASRMAAANGNDGSDTADGHVRGAIDIVKGLERKRQRRKEKFQCKGRKHHSERKPQPGKGAERMRELGLLMAGKTGETDTQNPYMMSA
jgi:hypothetical protein